MLFRSSRLKTLSLSWAQTLTSLAFSYLTRYSRVTITVTSDLQRGKVKMSLKLINACLSAGVGGEQVAFARYSSLLQDLGHNVITCVRHGAAITASLKPGSKVLALPSAFERDPRTVWRAAQVDSEFQPDAIIAHSRRTFIAFAAMKTLFGRDTPLIRVVQIGRAHV